MKYTAEYTFNYRNAIIVPAPAKICYIVETEPCTVCTVQRYQLGSQSMIDLLYQGEKCDPE